MPNIDISLEKQGKGIAIALNDKFGGALYSWSSFPNFTLLKANINQIAFDGTFVAIETTTGYKVFNPADIDTINGSPVADIADAVSKLKDLVYANMISGDVVANNFVPFAVDLDGDYINIPSDGNDYFLFAFKLATGSVAQAIKTMAVSVTDDSKQDYLVRIVAMPVFSVAPNYLPVPDTVIEVAKGDAATPANNLVNGYYKALLVKEAKEKAQIDLDQLTYFTMHEGVSIAFIIQNHGGSAIKARMAINWSE